MTSYADTPSTPLEPAQLWLREAEGTEPNDPNAAALATASHAGLPSVRMVLVKGIDERGFRFFTNTGSRKGHDLHENPFAALCFHWKSSRRQLRVEGTVQELAPEEVDTYFHTRSRASQIAAAVSHQSHILASRDALLHAVEAYGRVVKEDPVPTPSEWGGYLLVPNRYEFWSDGENRLHHRVAYEISDGVANRCLLYP